MSTRRRTNRMSARHKKRRQDALRAILTVALCGACAYVALATAVGGFIAENIIAPIFRGISGQNEAQSALALSPGQMEEIPKATSEIQVEAKTYYALSVGAFASKENADNLAASIRGRSGAGYVHSSDDLYRVLAAVYDSESAAKSVKEQLMTQNGLESTLYKISIPAITMKVTAEEDYLSAVQEGFSAAETACASLFQLCTDYDAGKMTIEEVCDKLLELAEMCAAPAQLLENTGSPAADGLFQLLSQMSKDLTEAGSQITENSLEFSSTLKYTQIKEICAYSLFTGNIAAQ